MLTAKHFPARMTSRVLAVSDALTTISGGSSETLVKSETVMPWTRSSLHDVTIATPEAEMYTFSLGKHLTMIGIVFAYFALRGRSRAAIQAGLIYAPVALLIDWIPPLTWFAATGSGTSLFPPIFWVAVVSCALSAVGLTMNFRHVEWMEPQAAGAGTDPATRSGP